jgi:hypothetical protein
MTTSNNRRELYKGYHISGERRHCRWYLRIAPGSADLPIMSLASFDTESNWIDAFDDACRKIDKLLLC